MMRIVGTLLFSFLLVLEVQAKDCSNVPYKEFFEESTKVFKDNIKDYNSCIYQMLESYKKNGDLTVVQNPETHVYMVYPKNGSAAAIVVQYSDASDKEQGEWGEDKIFLSRSAFDKNNWSLKSGHMNLRKDESGQFVADQRTVGWKKDRLDVVLPPGACVKKECAANERWSSVRCECIVKACSPDKIQKEKNKCASESTKKVGHNYEIEFLYTYNENDCSCDKTKNSEFIPPSKRSCAPSTEEYAKKKSECEGKSNENASYKLDDNCKCDKTKLLCDGKYTKDSFKVAKETCEKTPNHKWQGCECKDPNGQNACVYKEKRKFVGSFSSNKMTFNRDKGSEEHFDNEAPPRMGPCDMENWLKNIGSDKKNVKDCDDYEKLVIKKKGYEPDDKFKEKRFFCTKCKDGYLPVEKTTSIDGVNDDWMEQNAYSYVSECKKDNSCTGPKYEEKQKRCTDKNKDEQNIKRGISYSWVNCKCEKEKNPPERIPRSCMDKISQGKIDRCHDRDGIIDEKTCECKAPCYDIVKDTDQLPTGEVTCKYAGSNLLGAVADVDKMLNQVVDNQCDGAAMKMVKNDFAEKREELIKKCQEQTGIAGEEGVKSKSIELSVMVTNEVSCPPIVIENTSNGFADKIPGLVGGLDLKKDFTQNGKPITDPGSVDCAKGDIRYSPAEKPSQGKHFKTGALSQAQCNNVKAMYKDVQEKAKKYVDSIMSNTKLTPAEKISLINSNFKANVFATANRLPHGDNSVDHTELSGKRADSMRDFYVDQVAEEIKKFDPNFDASKLKSSSSISTIPYFGPPPQKGYEQAKDANYVACKSEVDARTKNAAEKPKLVYECMVSKHVDLEMDQLKGLDDKNQTHLASNFSKAVTSNQQFKDYLKAHNLASENFDIYANKDAYKDFLNNQFAKSEDQVNSFLDTMKIFDLDANSKLSLDVDKTVQTELKMSCNLNFEDLYKDEPVLADHKVYYGKRPGFVERFKKSCREDFDQMLDKLQDELSKDHQDLKKDLISEYGAEKGNRKFNREMRDLAKKQWRYAKYNTKQVNKALDGHNRWNQFDGSHAEDDGRLNKTGTFDSVIKPSIQAEEQGTGDWDQTKYKNKSLDDK